MKDKIRNGIAIIQMMREDTAGQPKTKKEELWFWLFDNYMAMQNGELTKVQIDKLNSIDPNWKKHIEGEIIKTYKKIRGV